MSYEPSHLPCMDTQKDKVKGSIQSCHQPQIQMNTTRSPTHARLRHARGARPPLEEGGEEGGGR